MANTPGDFKPGHTITRMPDEEAEIIAKELIAWAKEPDACHFSEFTGRKEMTRAWLNNLMKNHPCIAKAFDMAREQLAARYARKGLFNDWNSSLVSRWIGIYDSDVKEHEVAMAQAKGVTKDEVGELIVNVMKYTNESKGS